MSLLPSASETMSMPRPVRVAVGVSVPVAMSVTLADLGLRELPQAAVLEGCEAGGDVRLPGEVDSEACPLQPGEGATTETAAKNGIHRSAHDGVERATGTVLVGFGPVADGFPLPGVQVEEGEER